jgi:hypothetical protein
LAAILMNRLVRFPVNSIGLMWGFALFVFAVVSANSGIVTAATPAGITDRDSLNLPATTAVGTVASFLNDAGLTRRRIFDLDFEPDSSVWLAAADGLYHYDGYTWRRFSIEDGLPSSFVRCVLRTRNGVLWVGTDKGAGTFDGKKFNFIATEAVLAGPSVRRIVEDPDGTLWFCSDTWPDTTVSGGLTRYSIPGEPGKLIASPKAWSGRMF